MKNDAHFDTLLAHFGEDSQNYHGAVVPPIYQNSLFTFESAEAIDAAFSNMNDSCIYTRGNNPTVMMAEEKIAALEGGERAKLFASGMAAITAGILSTVQSGDHIVCVKSVYGPTNNFISKYLGPKFGITSTFVDGGDLMDFHQAVNANTRLIYLESPSSGVFSMQDLDAISTFAKSKNITTIIDNTWATPLFQNPLLHGIDLVVHSASKYLSGHSDVVAGVLIGSKVRIDAIFLSEFLFFGGKIAPFEAWLILRGLRTLSLRMMRHQESTQKVIAFLEKQPLVEVINYPGHSSYKQPELAQRYLKGFSGLFSFTLKATTEKTKAFINALQLFQIGVSWGGFESLVYAPIISLEKEMTPEQLQASGVKPGLIRLSIGLEHAEDLIADLEQALRVI